MLKTKSNRWFSRYPEKYFIKYCNFIMLLIILHESSHVWQQNGLEAYSEINRLYNDIYSERIFSLKEFIKIIKFYFNMISRNDTDLNERHANIDAFRELIDIYQGCFFQGFIEYNHMVYLSFKAKRESLVHDTLFKYLLEYNYNCMGIPDDLLFEIGLPTSEEYLISVYDAIDKYFCACLSYKDTIKTIKKINAKKI